MLCGINNVLQNIPHIQSDCEAYSAKYCQSHITLLWISIMVRPCRDIAKEINSNIDA